MALQTQNLTEAGLGIQAGQLPNGVQAPERDSMWKAILLPLGILLLALCCGCSCGAPNEPIPSAPVPLQGIQISDYGHARAPRLAWNGSHFGVMFTWIHSSGNYGDIYIMTVDKDGTIVKGPESVHSVPFSDWPGYEPFLISDLVWNPDDQQFALAYSYGKAIYFTRYNANLGRIYPQYVKIDFPGLLEEEHPRLVDVSLTWNTVRDEYGLAFVTYEDPYDEDRHNDIYLWQIKADGTVVQPPEAIVHAVNCPYDCWRTSLASSSENGDYAIAYYTRGVGANSTRAMVAFIDQDNRVREHHVLAPWVPTGAGPIRIHYDRHADDYLVVAATMDGALMSQTVKPDGSASPAASRPSEGAFPWVYSMDNFFCQGRSYMICAGAGGQARCWLLSRTEGHDPEDWIYPADDSVKRYDPFVEVVANTAYVAWVEGNSVEEANVYFGPFSEGAKTTPPP